MGRRPQKENTMATKKNNGSYWNLPGFIRNKKSRFVFNAGFNSCRMLCDTEIEKLNPKATEEKLTEMKKAALEMCKWAKLVQTPEKTKVAYRPVMEPKQILKTLKCLKGFEPLSILMKAANLKYAKADNDKRWAIAREAFNKYFDKDTYFGDNDKDEQESKPEPKQESKPEPKPQANKKKGNGADKPKTEPKPQPPVENTKEDKIMNMLQQMQKQMAADKAANEAALAALSERIGD